MPTDPTPSPSFRHDHDGLDHDGHDPDVADQDASATFDLARWQGELVALLNQIEAARSPEAEAGVVARVAALDPDLQDFLLARLAEQDSPEAAAFLAALAAQASTPGALRARAREALDGMAARGIRPPAVGAERFHTGWVQEGRERGEQIMILGWRLPNADLEALVFLIDWRGDAVKDFYRTRSMGDAEWDTLVEHNGGKGAPLTEITLAEGRALLRAALAEAQRYSRPMPREYKLAQSLIQRRILDAPAANEVGAPRHFIGTYLSPEAVVSAYVEALHYRDYALAWELLAPDHPRRLGVDLAAGVDALRRELKPAPRRRAEVTTAVDSDVVQGAAEATVRADGAEEATERGGRRVRQPVRERYTLHRERDGWRIANIERL